MEEISNNKMKLGTEEMEFELTSIIEIKEEKIEFCNEDNHETGELLDMPTSAQPSSKNISNYRLANGRNEMISQLTRQHFIHDNEELALPSAEDLGLSADFAMPNIHDNQPANDKDNVGMLSNMCRICGLTSNSLKDIFSRTSVLSLLLRQYLKVIKVSKNDQLPLKVCLPCRSTMFAFHEIQQRLDTAQNMLQSEQQDMQASLVCRVCRQSSDDMMHIFSEEAYRTLQLPVLVTAYLPRLQVSRSDSVSLHVCLSCRTTLHAFHTRKQQCVAAEDKMRNILRSAESRKPPQELAVNKNILLESTNCAEDCPVLEDDPTMELLNCDPTKPPYKCVFKFCLWNTKSQKRRCNLQSLSNHYTLDHKVYLCKYCFEIFKIKQETIEHVRKSHMVPCNICYRSFIGHDNLNEHKLKLHRPIIPETIDSKYQCEYCYEIFEYVPKLKYHLRTQHGIVKSSKCNQVFKTETERQEHDLQNHDAFCPFCNILISSDKGMKTHLTSKHKNQQVNELIFKLPAMSTSLKTYTCKFCNRKLPSKNSVKHHYFWFHKKFACEFCLLAFPSRELERLHFKQNHQCECIECNVKYSTSQEVENHMETIHLDLKFYFCEFCGLAFNNRDKLEDHRSTHITKDNKSGNTPEFLCDLCGKVLKSKKSLTSHKQIHISEEINASNTCQYCDRPFKTLPGLNLHITLKHTGIPEIENNFQCKICKKYFECYSKLEEHQIRHHKYKCDLCNIQYMFRSNLEEHMQEIHRPPVAYKCLECGKVLCSEQGFNLHVQCAHIGSSYQASEAQISVLRCQLCINVFLNKKILKSHIIKQHNIKEKKITNVFRKKIMGRKPYLVKV